MPNAKERARRRATRSNAGATAERCAQSGAARPTLGSTPDASGTPDVERSDTPDVEIRGQCGAASPTSGSAPNAWQRRQHAEQRGQREAAVRPHAAAVVGGATLRRLRGRYSDGHASAFASISS